MGNAISAFSEARKEKTRVALRMAMLELLAEKPFDQIQILDLTGRAGVGYTTFFRHYVGTADVLDEIAGDQIRELLAMTIPIFQHVDTEASARALCEYVFERRPLWTVLLTGGAAHSVRSEFIAQALEKSRKINGRTMSVPLDLGTFCAAGSAIDALTWWLNTGATYPIDDMAAFVNRMTIAPFAPAERPRA